MGILRGFEQRLESVFEGLFARAFRSSVQPVELGKRLVRTLEEGRTIGVSRTYVPNVFIYELSPEDRERFADYEQALCEELAKLAVTTARDHDWAMLGPARVVFETADDLVEGRFRVAGRVEPAAGREQEARGPAPDRGYGPAPGPVGPQTAMLPGEVRPPRSRAPASLVLLSGRHEERTFDLVDLETVIGRGEGCHVTLPDPGVSRRHARVLREGDDFVIEDLRSTNGTEVNGKLIVRRRLADGDMIKMGSSTLLFRRGQ